MKNYPTLPDGYHELYRFDLSNDKKASVLVFIATLAVAALMIVPATLFNPIISLFDPYVGLARYIARILTLVLGAVAFYLTRELVRGFLIRRVSGVKPSYTLSGLAVYAGSNTYFCRRSYTLLTLFPTIFYAVLLTVVCCFVPPSWFWVVYLIQVFNISGISGDVYLLCKLSSLPPDILVQDSGHSVRVYSRAAQS